MALPLKHKCLHKEDILQISVEMSMTSTGQTCMYVRMHTCMHACIFFLLVSPLVPVKTSKCNRPNNPPPHPPKNSSSNITTPMEHLQWTVASYWFIDVRKSDSRSGFRDLVLPNSLFFGWGALGDVMPQSRTAFGSCKHWEPGTHKGVSSAIVWHEFLHMWRCLSSLFLKRLENSVGPTVKR